MKLLRVFLTLILALLALLLIRPATAPTAAADPLPRPHLGYGLNIRHNLNMAQGMGFEWIKLYEDWLPDPNAFPAEALGYHILYRLKAEGQPFSLDTYLAHVRQVVEAGRGKIQAYEVGNEPNLWMFWGQQNPDPGRYGRLLCNVYTLIKSIDPQVTVVSAGLAPVGRTSPLIWNLAMDDRVFTQQMFDAIRAAYPAQFPCFDAYGYHPQGFPYPPEMSYEELEQQHPDDNGNAFYFRSSEWYHALMDVNGIGDHPIWLTEFGWMRDPADDPYYGDMSYQNYGWCDNRSDFPASWMRVPEAVQADYLVRAYQYADANMPWIGGMFVFNIDWNTEGWECASDKYFSIYKATTGLPESDPRTKVPSLAVQALTNMPKRSAFTGPMLSAEPGAFTFLTELLTPTMQTQTLRIASSQAGAITWTIQVSTALPGLLIATPVSGTQSAAVAVQLNTAAIAATGYYQSQLIITGRPTSTGSITVPVNVIVVDQLHHTYLPLMFKNYSTPIPPMPPVTSTQELGLAFVSSAESPAGETRYQQALAIDGRLNRWPMYWPQIETNPIGQPRVFDWSKQDANIIADINHGMTVLPILMLTPIGLDTGGSRLAPVPQVGDGLRLQMQDRSLNVPSAPSSQGSPPQGLYLSVFSDGSDDPGPGKTINPNNRWAYFVNAAVNRYKPNGTLAQAQGWSSDKGMRYWEIWNEEDLNQFFIGTPADFARIQKVAYLAAKQADPNATIVFGGLAHFEKPTWLNDVLSVIATDPMSTTYHGFMDAVASHNYSWAWQTFYYLLQDRQRLDARGLTGVKLWLTETGVPVCDDPPYVFCAAPYRGTMSEQADFLIQTVAWANWLSAEKIVWFQLYDDCGNDGHYDAFGLVRNPSSVPACPLTARDGTPRAAYNTYKLANQIFSGVQPYWRDRRTGTTSNWTNGNQEILAFKRPAAGQRIVTMWTRYYTADTVVLTATSSAAVLFYPDGTSQILTPVNGAYTINLPAATNLGASTSDGKQPDGTSSIGGAPRILVELDPAVTP